MQRQPAHAEAAEPCGGCTKPTTTVSVTTITSPPQTCPACCPLIPTVCQSSTDSPRTPEDTANDPINAINDDDESVLFSWITETGGFRENWQQGLGLAVLGVMGALVAMFLFIGDPLPSMGGQVRVREMEEEIVDLREKWRDSVESQRKLLDGTGDMQSERLAARQSHAEGIASQLSELRGALARERWRQFGIAIPLYVALGGFFAAAVATNLLQAVVIGFGWTALLDRFGLKRKNEDTKGVAVEAQDVAAEAAVAIEKVEEEKRQLEAERDRYRDAAVGALEALRPSSTPSPGEASEST